MSEMTRPIQQVTDVTLSATDLAVRFGPRVFVALLIVVAGWFIGAWLARMTDRMLASVEVDVAARQLLTRIVRVLVLALFVVMALQNLGVELLPLIAGFGIAGAGVALAMQGVLSNLAAGLTIILTRPFRVGDYVAIIGVEGRVEEITLFSTRLGHTDLSRVVVPNRKIVGEVLHNYGQVRQLNLAAAAPYGADLGRAISAIHEVLEANARVLREPAPVVQVLSLGESSVSIAVKPWVQVTDCVAAQGEINRALVDALQRVGTSPAFPRRDVRIVQ